MFAKFTSLLTAGALVLGTGMAAPARADNDTAEIFGALIAGGVIGALIANDSNKSRNRGHSVSRNYRNDGYRDDSFRGGHSRGHDTGYGHSKRVNLPGACRVNSGHRSGYSGNCLRGYSYSHAALPSACAVHVGGHHRTIYRDRCLNQYGYY
ncbi:hypothetical protein ACSSV4_000210 [Roseovarius sp. MBR-154]|jgi:hypothetical protein